MTARGGTILAAIAALGFAFLAVEAHGSETAITCTNPASGASWQIKIDYERRTVDSYPARIDEAQVSWHDEKEGGNYTLDRKSGNLTFVYASSTGGSFLFHRCKLEN
jgi:hypothetical protein